MKLTDTQLVLLSAASQREDCAVELAPNLKGGAAHKVVGKLLSEGLVEEIPARGALPIHSPRVLWVRYGFVLGSYARRLVHLAHTHRIPAFLHPATIASSSVQNQRSPLPL